MSIPVSTPNTAFTRPQSLNSVEAKPASAKAAAATIDPKVKDKSFGFLDLLDVINPLQHIPVVNSIYRHVTGDEIGSVARIAGGALFGGVLGAALGAANAASAYVTDGKDISDVALTKVGIIKPDGQLVSASDSKEVVHFPSAIPFQPDPAGLPIVEVRPLAATETDSSVQLANIETSSGAALAMPSALPSAKELNDLEPGSDPATKVAENAVTNELVTDVPKPDVEKNMLQALAKYQAMQKTSIQNSAPTAISNPNAEPAVKNSGIIPVNYSANMPVPIPGQVESRKENASFNKFRHF